MRRLRVHARARTAHAVRYSADAAGLAGFFFFFLGGAADAEADGAAEAEAETAGAAEADAEGAGVADGLGTLESPVSFSASSTSRDVTSVPTFIVQSWFASPCATMP